MLHGTSPFHRILLECQCTQSLFCINDKRAAAIHREFVKKPSSKSCFLSMVQLKAWFGTYQICQLLLKHPWQQYIMDGSRCSCRDVPPLPLHTGRPCIIFPPEYSPTAGLTCTTSPLCAGKVWSWPCAKPSAYHLPVERQRVGHQEDQVWPFINAASALILAHTFITCHWREHGWVPLPIVWTWQIGQLMVVNTRETKGEGVKTTLTKYSLCW